MRLAACASCHNNATLGLSHRLDEKLERPTTRNQQHWVFASADIVAHYSGAVQLREEDIILTEKKVNFSMGADNPMDKVRNRCRRVPASCAVEFIISQAEVKFPNGRRQFLHERRQLMDKARLDIYLSRSYHPLCDLSHCLLWHACCGGGAGARLTFARCGDSRL